MAHPTLKAETDRIRNRCTGLHAARLRPGQQVTLPEAPFLHLFVRRGSAVTPAEILV